MKLVILIFFIVSVLVSESCSSKRVVSRDLFEKIEIGMTTDEVKNLIGSPHKVSDDKDSSTYYFYLIQDDILARKYASIKFDKFGLVSFKLYYTPD